MASKNIDKERLKQKIALIGEKIGGDIDPHLLNEYRLLFKKGFSFFRRSWAAAYLLMLYDQGEGAGGRERSRFRPPLEGERVPGRNEGFPRREGRFPSVPQDVPRPFLAEEESRRLFVSIGRNRRVFPREILGLIITRAQVAREDIGMIRILDSYSFVQVRDTVADTIIEALNGAVFRGRPMTVNSARLKREEGQSGDQGLPPAGGEAVADTTADAVRDGAAYTTGDGAAGFAELPEESYPGEQAPEPEEPGVSEEDYPDGSEQGDDQADKEGV
jgi:hypothetical protein